MSRLAPAELAPVEPVIVHYVWRGFEARHLLKFASTMAHPDPIYSVENCKVAYQLNWSYALFWLRPPADFGWLPDLQQAWRRMGFGSSNTK